MRFLQTLGGFLLAALAGCGLTATPASAALADAVEYYHSGLGHYFITARPDETAILDDGTVIQGWVRTGQTFKVNAAPVDGLFPVCRFYSTSFGAKSSHFYTPFEGECAIIKQNADWQFEANAFYAQLPTSDGACPAGTQNVYRLYNNSQGGAPNHRYTTSLAIRSDMIAQGWIPEGAGTIGVIFCTAAFSAGDGSVAYTQTARLLGGTWHFSYTFGTNSYNDPYTLWLISPGTSTMDIPWMAQGANQYGVSIFADYYVPTGHVSLVSPLATSWDLFIFDFVDDNTVSGCYYFLLNSAAKPQTCWPFTGARQ